MTEMKIIEAPEFPPEISLEDQLTLKKMESKALQLQVQVQGGIKELHEAQRQLQQFGNTMFEKYGVNKDKYMLDIERLVFAELGKN